MAPSKNLDSSNQIYIGRNLVFFILIFFLQILYLGKEVEKLLTMNGHFIFQFI